jgi:tetratricopeptide (TPR) repeat protein
VKDVRSFGSKTVSVLIVSLSWLPLVAQSAQDVPHKVAVLEQQAQKALQEQKPEIAIPVLREIISLDPKNLNAQGNLGVLLFFQISYAEAIPPLRAALQLKPDLWRIEGLLGIAEKRTGAPREAQNDLERAFSNLDDKNFRIEVGLELIELDSASAQFDKALAAVTRVEELAPDNPKILFVAFEISQQMAYQSLLNMMMVGPDSAEMHMMMAGELGRQGDHTNAIAQYREAIRLNPLLPGAHFELAEQLRTSTDPALNAQAEDEYKAAIKANRYDELSWRQLGETMSTKGDFKAAEEDYRRALALQPKDSNAKTGLAIALISLNQTDDAISLLENAAKDDPTNMTAHYRLSILYRRAGRTVEAQHELDQFQHYKELRDKLGKIFKNLAAPNNPM